jgi:hypothetical protein
MSSKRLPLEPFTEVARDRAMRPFGIPVIPTLLGALAVLNVASVVMVLME